jgi:hypothetical protein
MIKTLTTYFIMYEHVIKECGAAFAAIMLWGWSMGMNCSVSNTLGWGNKSTR